MNVWADVLAAIWGRSAGAHYRFLIELAIYVLVFVNRETLWSWIRTGASWVHSQWRSRFSGLARLGGLTRIILRDNITAGPFKNTLGRIYKNSPFECAQLALAIERYAPVAGVDVAVAAGWIFRESRFSLRARNPNNQDAVPGETPDQAWNHCDISVVQFDGSTLRERPEFAGKTTAEIEQMLLDPNFVLKLWAEFVSDLMTWAKAWCAANPTAHLPDHGALALGILAYNKGDRGAALVAMKPYDPDAWAYANNVLASADQYAKELR